MLDHRNGTTSSSQYADGPGIWTGEMNAFGWRAVLGDLAGDEVPRVRLARAGRRPLGSAGHLHRRRLRRSLP